MTKSVIIICIVLCIVLRVLDINPVANYVERVTGKSPHDWGYIAGVKTRHFFTGDSHD